MFPLRKNPFRIHTCNVKSKQSWKRMFCVRFTFVFIIVHRCKGGIQFATKLEDPDIIQHSHVVSIISIILRYIPCAVLQAISVDSLHGNGMCKTPEITMLVIRGSVKNNWELSNISKTMKRNLLKFSICIEQSYLHNPNKESTPQRDVKKCDVIFSDVILRSPFAQWKSEKLKRKVQLLYWEWLS